MPGIISLIQLFWDGLSALASSVSGAGASSQTRYPPAVDRSGEGAVSSMGYVSVVDLVALANTSVAEKQKLLQKAGSSSSCATGARQDVATLTSIASLSPVFQQPQATSTSPKQQDDLQLSNRNAVIDVHEYSENGALVAHFLVSGCALFRRLLPSLAVAALSGRWAGTSRPGSSRDFGKINKQLLRPVVYFNQTLFLPRLNSMIPHCLSQAGRFSRNFRIRIML